MGITQEIRPVPKKLGQARFSGVSNPIFSVTRLTVCVYGSNAYVEVLKTANNGSSNKTQFKTIVIL